MLGRSGQHALGPLAGAAGGRNMKKPKETTLTTIDQNEVKILSGSVQGLPTSSFADQYIRFKQ